MKYCIAIASLIIGFGTAAHADVWKWVDVNGDTHFVETKQPIFTWTDEFGKVHYSDTPDHEDAVSVVFMWHSAGSLADVDESAETAAEGSAIPAETAEERAVREAAEAAYCERMTEIYESYINAPRLYRTNEDGEREFLSKREAAKMIAETRAAKDENCS